VPTTGGGDGTGETAAGNDMEVGDVVIGDWLSQPARPRTSARTSLPADVLIALWRQDIEHADESLRRLPGPSQVFSKGVVRTCFAP
jgi:hypothetical protein